MFKQDCDELFYKIKANIDAINDTKIGKKNRIDGLEKKIDLYVLTSSYILNVQQLYLKEAEFHKTDVKEIVRTDYTCSYFAYKILPPLKTIFFILKRMISDKDKEEKHFALTRIEEVDKCRIAMMYISARWHIEQFMEFFDEDKPENRKKLPRRLPLLKDVMFCFDRMLSTKMGIISNDGFNPKRLVVALPPSSGKTYCANCYTVLMLAHNQIRYGETGIIRTTNTADNARAYGGQVFRMMSDASFINIFPEHKKYLRVNTVLSFKNASAEQYLLKDCSSECTDSLFMFGIDASINGKRALLGVIGDDMSGGQSDMDNDELHKKITDKIMSDVLDRSDDDNSPFVFMGTMYNENDVQNSFINKWEILGMKDLIGHKYIRVTLDGKCATCIVDIENEKGESIAPLLYTNEKLKEKRQYFENRNKLYVYNLIYRQHKDSREPKTFEWSSLQTYDELPADIDICTKSYIDTTRKNGNDFFANPYFSYRQEDKKWYFKDVVFEQKSLGMDNDPKNLFRDKICKTLVDNNCVECVIESNTSNTTGDILKMKCKELGYNYCKFRNKFTVAVRGVASSKVVRILNMEETIKNHIVFPSKTAKMSAQMYMFMQQLTQWSSKISNPRTNHDDAPDVVAMFAQEFLFKSQSYGSIIGFDRNSIF